jgi:hypothetical protein
VSSFVCHWVARKSKKRAQIFIREKFLAWNDRLKLTKCSNLKSSIKYSENSFLIYSFSFQIKLQQFAFSGRKFLFIISISSHKVCSWNNIATADGFWRRELKLMHKTKHGVEILSRNWVFSFNDRTVLEFSDKTICWLINFQLQFITRQGWISPLYCEIVACFLYFSILNAEIILKLFTRINSIFSWRISTLNSRYWLRCKNAQETETILDP